MFVLRGWCSEKVFIKEKSFICKQVQCKKAKIRLINDMPTAQKPSPTRHKLLSTWALNFIVVSVTFVILAPTTSQVQANKLQSLTASKHNKPTQHQAQSESRSQTGSDEHQTAVEFARPIGNISAVAGRDARLVCVVDNLAEHKVAWLKLEPKTIISIGNNVLFTNYRYYLITGDDNRQFVLIIRDVQPSDKGFYQCQVNTQPMKFTVGHLDVLVPPNIDESRSTKVVRVDEFANASLECHFSGHPKPVTVWHRDDGNPIKFVGFIPPMPSSSSQISSKLRASRRLQTTNYPTTTIDYKDNKDSSFAVDKVRGEHLALSYIDRTMSGVYVCSATNNVAPDATKRVAVYVRFPPKVYVQSKFVSVNVGEQLVVDCFVEAFPRPQSAWLRIQSPYSSSSIIQLLSGSSLVNQNNSKLTSDEELDNEEQYLNSSPLATEIGATSVFSVKQTAVNAYTYKLTLVVSRTRRSDFGWYACQAKNLLGESDARVEVTEADAIAASTVSLRSQQEEAFVTSIKPTLVSPAKQTYNNNKDTQHHQMSTPSPWSQNKGVVYDQHYLEAIRARQGLLEASSTSSSDTSLSPKSRRYKKPRNSAFAVTMLSQQNFRQILSVVGLGVACLAQILLLLL